MVGLLMTDAAKIARGLTKAQRWLILASGPDDISGKSGVGVDLRGSMYSTAKKLHRMGLGDYTHGSPFSDMYWNNTLGLAVRAELERIADE